MATARAATCGSWWRTADFVAVGFNIPVAELVAARDLGRHRELRQLGPDLLAESFDAAEALRRMKARPAEAIADVLLNQRVMAGIGNVYKSEVLFACRVNPFTAVGHVGDQALESLVATARRLLLANVHSSLAPMTTYTGYRRTTNRDNPSERLWVYGRAGKPCRRCGTAVTIDKQGTDARLTYWCPGCQGDRLPAPARTASSGSVPPVSSLIIWMALIAGACAAAAALYGHYLVLPGWLTGPEICQLEHGGCQVLFRSPRARLLGVPNAALGILLYVHPAPPA